MGPKTVRRVAVLAFAPALVALAAGAATASTSNPPPTPTPTPGSVSTVALGHGKTMLLATGPETAIPQFSGCGWTPANDSKVSGTYNESGVYIRSGADTSCAALGEGFPGQSVTVHCVWYNSGDGLIWDFLTDNTTGVRGWSADEYVNWTGGVLGC